MALMLAVALGQGCIQLTDAPCEVDGDCLVDNAICQAGVCAAVACNAPAPCAIASAADCVGSRGCVGGVLGPCLLPRDGCDGADGDCDGDGAGCSTGLPGACAAGRTVCGAGDTVCVPIVEASDESCDGIDSDCDGQVDEGAAGEPLVEACYEGPEDTPEVGVCRGGVRTCVAGRFGACDQQVLPTAEICDLLDNDCNGEADDLDGAGDACAVGEGACARGGRVACGDDGVLACDVEPGDGAPETCNGIDDDCDGVVDDVEGSGDPCEAGVGRCRAVGAWVCGDDGLECDAAALSPEAERCNGADDDCDGGVDEIVACIARCGNGRRERDEACDDGNAVDGDGCSALCGVEAGFECLDGPPDTVITIDGRLDCGRFVPAPVPAWSGTYGVIYLRGAVAFDGDNPRYTAFYGVRTTNEDGALSFWSGLAPVEGFAYIEGATVEETEAIADRTLNVLAPGLYDVIFGDENCQDNRGSLDVEFRTFDRCRRPCAVDADCGIPGEFCIDGGCAPPAPACGDAAVDRGEGCDDGNLVGGDGCSAACIVEPGFACEPLDLGLGVSDHIDAPDLGPPVWQGSPDGRTLTASVDSAPSIHATDVRISPDRLTRFELAVDGDIDSDIIGWSIGGGPAPLSAPDAPYLLFSWKRRGEQRPGFGQAPAGLRVARVDGPPAFDALWQLDGQGVEEIASALRLGAMGWRDRRAYTVSVIGDGERVRVYVDDVLEFDLRYVPLGDRQLGFYAYTQPGARLTLLAPAAQSMCRD